MVIIRLFVPPGIWSLIVLFAVYGWAGAINYAEASSLTIEGESYQYNKETGIYVYKNPRIESDGEIITARYLTYDSGQKLVRAKGDITLFMKNIVVTGEDITYDLDTKIITVTKGTLLDTRSNYFATAEKIERVRKDKFVVYGATFTKCDPTSPAWELSTSYAVYYVDDYAYAQNLVFSMYSVPFLYTPFLAWTTKRYRGSGLLPPRYSYQHSSNPNRYLGHRLQIPFFLDLAKYHDITLEADLIERRGVGLSAEYNYAFTEGMLGRLKQWRIQEALSEDLDYKGEKPYRSTTEFQHRQTLSENSQLFLYQLENTDNEVRKEYFNSSIQYDWDWKRSVNTVFYWDDGGISLSADDGAKFTKESVKNKENDADTHLNKLPEVTLEHTFSRIGDSNLTADFQGKSTLFDRKTGWRGFRHIGIVSLSYPFQVDFLQVIPLWSRRATNYQVQYQSEETIQESDFKDTYNGSWNHDHKQLELSFEVYRLFSDKNKPVSGKLSFRPRLLYDEIDDVDQRGILNRTPDQYSMTGTPDDYEQYEYMFDKEDNIYSKRILTFRLDTEYRRKFRKTGERYTLFKLSLVQPYNLSRKNDLEEIETKTNGPQINESYQETSLGNQRMPLRLVLEISPNENLRGSLFYRYDHEERKIIETRMMVSFNLATAGSLSMTYLRNTKAYQTQDGDLEPIAYNYSMNNSLRFGENFQVSLGGVWDFTRFSKEDEPGTTEKLNRTLIDGMAGVVYQHDCYVIAAQYNEKIQTGWFGDKEREYIDRSVTIKVSLTEVDSQRKFGL